MRFFFPSLFLVLGAFLCWSAIDAGLTGRLAARSPQYPVLAEKTPILFWGLVIGLFWVGMMCVRVAYLWWTSARDEQTARPDDRDSAPDDR